MKGHLLTVLLLLAAIVYAVPGQAKEKSIYGQLENILIMPEGISLRAKMDTGAYRSALQADNIKIFEKNGEKWVSFDLHHDNIKEHLEKPFLKDTRIKNRVGEHSKGSSQKRPVISLDLCLGNRLIQVEASLADRSNFKNPLLIGRRAMTNYDMVIDPSLKRTAEAQCQDATLNKHSPSQTDIRDTRNSE